jgi:hypothetical protein
MNSYRWDLIRVTVFADTVFERQLVKMRSVRLGPNQIWLLFLKGAKETSGNYKHREKAMQGQIK